MKDATASENAHQEALDQTYLQFANKLERLVCRATDTPPSRGGSRAEPPRIKYVSAKARCARHRKSWNQAVWAVQWMLNRTVQWFRSLDGILEGAAETTFEDLCEELHSPPPAVLLIPAAGQLVKDMQATAQQHWQHFTAGDICLETARRAVDSFASTIKPILEQERQRAAQSTQQAWNSWVRAQNAGSMGWAHRWSKDQAIWQPEQVLH